MALDNILTLSASPLEDNIQENVTSSVWEKTGNITGGSRLVALLLTKHPYQV